MPLGNEVGGMWRAMGAGCIIAGASLLGERAARSEQHLLDVANGLLVSFTVLEAEIAYLTADLDESFRKAADAAPITAGLFLGAVNRMHQGERVTEAWDKSVASWCRTQHLPPRQQAVLKGLSAAWGPWQAADYVRHIRLAHRLMQTERDSLRDRIDNSCRLWRYLGVSGGLILALLLY